jgi:hypothetical protein
MHNLINFLFIFGLALVFSQSALSRPVSPIPPNCTLDPWTGKLNCHIPPNCTLDPWTGKLNCHVIRRP